MAFSSRYGIFILLFFTTPSFAFSMIGACANDLSEIEWQPNTVFKQLAVFAIEMADEFKTHAHSARYTRLKKDFADKLDGLGRNGSTLCCQTL